MMYGNKYLVEKETHEVGWGVQHGHKEEPGLGFDAVGKVTSVVLPFPTQQHVSSVLPSNHI